MKKCDFFTIVHCIGDHEIKTIRKSGYECTLKDDAGREFSFCFDNRKYCGKTYWSCSEKTTGMRVCGGYCTRGEVLQSLKDNYLNKLYDTMQEKHDMCDVFKRKISEAYKSISIIDSLLGGVRDE